MIQFYRKAASKRTHEKQQQKQKRISRKVLIVADINVKVSFANIRHTVSLHISSYTHYLWLPNNPPITTTKVQQKVKYI